MADSRKSEMKCSGVECRNVKKRLCIKEELEKIIKNRRYDLDEIENKLSIKTSSKPLTKVREEKEKEEKIILYSKFKDTVL